MLTAEPRLDEIRDARTRISGVTLRSPLIPLHEDQRVMDGNGTIGLEMVEDLPDVDVVLIPWGGGGLTCGIAAAIRASGHPCRIFACEVEHAAPLTASLAAGHPVETEAAVMFRNNRVVAEGAGACPVAVARSGRVEGGSIAGVVSGGNIDPETLFEILSRHPGGGDAVSH